MLSSPLVGTLALLLNTLLWGLTFPLIRLAVQDLAPTYFVFLRFLIATLLMSYLVLRNPALRAQLRGAFWPGILLGFFIAIGYLTQTIGLLTVPSPRASFITGINVLFVPFLSPLFGKGFPTKIDWLAAAIATAGLFLLLEPQTGAITTGDIWIFVCAIAVAFHIHLVKRVGAKGLGDMPLVYFQILGVLLASCLFLPSVSNFSIPRKANVLASLLICSVVATAGSLWLQIRYQKYVSAERAAIIFSFEPVFASLFGYAILGERLTGTARLGAAIILLALALSELRWVLVRAPHPSSPA